MSLVKLTATRIEKSERVTIKESLDFCFVHGEGFNGIYRVTKNGHSAIGEDKDCICRVVMAFYKTHNTTPKKIEIVYDFES